MEPTQFATSAYPQPPRYEFTVEQEKIAKTPEQEKITRKMRSIEQSIKNIQSLSRQKSVSYADLCMFPHVHLPLGFKTPKFEKYDGHGDPLAHLKRYCNQLRGVGRKEEFLMAYFRESLVGIASEWYMDQDISRWHIWDDLARDFVRQFQYNIDIDPDRNSLTNIKKKSSESFREYAVKWREQASRRAVEDLIEQKIIVLRDEDIPNVTNNPLPAHNNGPVIGMIYEDKEFDQALKAIIAIADMEKKPKVVAKQDKGEKKSKTTPQKTEKKVEVEIGAAPSQDVVLYVPRGRKKE
ncbi:uncharacterized protein [Nicotiana sylvestris]|uniref:uncharacterized protein n=1 Tax=Nicotiana sylvestris TaxID=4096 RepID=UPI00388C9908